MQKNFARACIRFAEANEANALISARIVRSVLTTGSIYAPSLRGNLLLRSLFPGDAELLMPHLKRVEIRAGEVVVPPDAPLAIIYFPETVVLCVRDSMRADRQPALGLVGLEGMAGWSSLLGAIRSPFLAAAEMHGGTALAIPADCVQEASATSDTLRIALLRYAGNFMLQMASTIGANATDAIERRVSRWILMLHDRTEGDTLDLTHDHMASALYVRRASITDCLHVLEGEQIVRCTRGRLVVRDRTRLEKVAGDAYGRVEARYGSEIAPFGKLNSAPGNL